MPIDMGLVGIGVDVIAEVHWQTPPNE
jgi:hypothetical protein